MQEKEARQIIDEKLEMSGWAVQDLKKIDLSVSMGVAVREYPTSTGEADYAMFVERIPVGIVEAKRSEKGENITDTEKQSARYAGSKLKYYTGDYRIRFVYEVTDEIVRFTDYDDIKYRSREIFSFQRPETLRMLMNEKDTVRNNLKHFPELDITGYRECQINAIKNLEKSFAQNRPKALIQMATGAGKTFTAISASYRLLKYGRMNRILFLVDTKSLGVQAENEFKSYRPNDDNRQFSEIYGVHRLKSSKMPSDVQIYISTIQRMYSMLKGEELDETMEENPEEYEKMTGKQPKEVAYNSKYPPEFFDCIIVDECHRSIYNLWKQVLEYFNAFIIGLTATPDKRTFAFFNKFVSCGSKDENTLTSLANRIIRLNAKMSRSEQMEFQQTVGQTASQTADKLLNAFDSDKIAENAGFCPEDNTEMTEEQKKLYKETQEIMIKEAVEPFYHPKIREFIENVRRSHEQLIDSVNTDEVIFAGFASQKEKDAEKVIQTFHDFIEQNKDEITALGIIYDQKYKDRPMVIRQLKVLYEKMKQKAITVERLWNCYSFRQSANIKKGTVSQLADLVCMIRYEIGLSDKLEPFSDRVNYNFMQWTLRRNAGSVHFTEEQMEWLRLIKEHISTSLSIQPDDLDLSPFDRKGGLGRF